MSRIAELDLTCEQQREANVRGTVTSEFKIISPNVIGSEDGELRIARVGLTVTFRGQRYVIDSEMLHPPMSIAIYFDSSRAAKADDAEQIREFVKGALAFAGFTVEPV